MSGKVMKGHDELLVERGEMGMRLEELKEHDERIENVEKHVFVEEPFRI